MAAPKKPAASAITPNQTTKAPAEAALDASHAEVIPAKAKGKSKGKSSAKAKPAPVAAPVTPLVAEAPATPVAAPAKPAAAATKPAPAAAKPVAAAPVTPAYTLPELDAGWVGDIARRYWKSGMTDEVANWHAAERELYVRLRAHALWKAGQADPATNWFQAEREVDAALDNKR